MAITAEQRILRRQYLGSSDLPAILALDPFRSPSDVYVEKTLHVEDRGNDATARGNLLEGAILDWAEGELKREFRRHVMVVHENGLMCCNFDGLIDDEQSVEAKSTVIEEGWGLPGSDEVPDRVIVQAHAGFACKPSLKVCHVPVLLPVYRKFDWRMYQVRRDEQLVAMVEEAAERFVLDHIRRLTPPDDFRPSLEILKRVRRQAKESVEVPEELIDDLIVARAAAAQAKKDAEIAEARLIAALGDAEAGCCGGSEAVTYFEIQRRGYTVEAGSYRALRIKKKREAQS